MKDEDVKKVQELALKKLLETNVAQENQIAALQHEVDSLKMRLGTGSVHSEIDVLQLLEQNKILMQKVALLELDIQRMKQDVDISVVPVDEKQISEKAERIDIRKRLVYTAVDSFSIYIFAYIFSFLLYNFVTLYAGQQFGLHGNIRYWGIEWPRTFDAAFWDSENIVKIFFAGSLVCLIVASFLYVLLKLFKKFYYKYQLFFAWVMLLCLNQFFGNYISGVITGKGFAYVTMALGLGFGNDIFIVLFMILVMYILGAVITKPFLYASSGFSLAEKQKRFLLYQVLYPSLAGNVLILFVKMPEVTAYEFFSLIMMYIMIVPMFYSSSLIFVRNSVISFHKNYRLNSYSKELIIASIVFLFALRILM